MGHILAPSTALPIVGIHGQDMFFSEIVGRRMSLDPKSVTSNPRLRGLDLFPKSKSETFSSPPSHPKRWLFKIPLLRGAVF
jgi:hypothetical protein